MTALPDSRQRAPASAVTFGRLSIDDPDDAERHPDPLDPHAVGPLPGPHHGSDRVGEGGNRLQAIRDRHHALAVERKPVE